LPAVQGTGPLNPARGRAEAGALRLRSPRRLDGRRSRGGNQGGLPVDRGARAPAAPRAPRAALRRRRDRVDRGDPGSVDRRLHARPAAPVARVGHRGDPTHVPRQLPRRAPPARAPAAPLRGAPRLRAAAVACSPAPPPSPYHFPYRFPYCTGGGMHVPLPPPPRLTCTPRPGRPQGAGRQGCRAAGRRGVERESSCRGPPCGLGVEAHAVSRALRPARSLIAGASAAVADTASPWDCSVSVKRRVCQESCA